MLSIQRTNASSLEEMRGEWYGESKKGNWEDDFVRLTDEWRAVEWRSGGKTLLAALGLQFNEVALCRGLAWLLDPQGGHGMGPHPLHAFMRSLDKTVDDSEPVQIHVEESRVDARADVVLRAGTHTVIIEAKILAGEQPKQADRLHEQWASENPTLIFLTRTGYLPFTAKNSEGLWVARTWRELAQMIRTEAERAGLQPSAGAREFIETIGAL